MKRILVTYATMAGSTAEVARAVAEEIASQDVQVEILPLSAVHDIAAYDGVVGGVIRTANPPGACGRPPPLASDPHLGGGAPMRGSATSSAGSHHGDVRETGAPYKPDP